MADQVTQKVIFRMVDAAGKEGTTSVQITTNAGSDPITSVTGYVALLNAASNAKVVGEVGQTANNQGVGLASTNVYDIRDKLAVEYVGSQNDHHVIHIGDLDPAVLDPTDKETVDPTNGDWLGVKSAIEANVKDKTGGSVTVIRGYRSRSRGIKTSLRFE
jgi:hypothetical protein